MDLSGNSIQHATGNASSEAASGDRVMNYSCALAAAGNDPELIEQLAAILLEQTPPLMHRIDQAIQEQNGEALARNSHIVRGSVGPFAAPSVEAAAGDLENIGLDSIWAHADLARNRLATQWDKLRTELESLLEESSDRNTSA